MDKKAINLKIQKSLNSLSSSKRKQEMERRKRESFMSALDKERKSRNENNN